MPTLYEKIEANAAARLELPVGRLPGQELARYRNFVKVETHRLKILHRGGGSGAEVCRARSVLIDSLLRHLLEGIRRNSPEVAAAGLPPYALVAIGGYGRAELNPLSDIDIMFLHGGDRTAANGVHAGLVALVNTVLYTLWDLNFKVGHSVRTPKDCVTEANKDMQSKTSLIEARLITGDAKLFEQFQEVVLTKCVAGYEDEYVVARLHDQAERRAKFGGSACMQEPNIKNGCGGLRDYQNLIWMTFFKYRTRSLAELEQKEMISGGERRQLERAYDFLLRVRNEMHYLTSSPSDVLARANQAAVAGNLGYHERSSQERIETFMRDLYNHTRNLYLITRNEEQRLALTPQATLMPKFRRLWRGPAERLRQQTVDGFKLLDGEIVPLSRSVFRDSPRRLIRVFLLAQKRGFKLHPDTAQLIRSHLHLVDNSFQRDPHVRETFLEILDQPGNVAPVLRAMHEVGFLGKFIPEFGRLTCLVQHEFYHRYATDEHILVCLEKLDQTWNSKTPPFASYAEIFTQIGRPHVLYLALLLHDAGKAARLGRHEEIGAQLALKVSRRLGLDGATTHTLCLLIEQHLTMIKISQRRDLDDPAVIRQFALQVQSEQHLNLLLLHSFADSMGTSDQLWNGFKDSVLWMLYRKTHDILSGGTEFKVAESRQRELLAEEIQRLKPPTFSDDEVHAHFENLPARYFQINDAKEVLRDIVQVHRFMRLQLSSQDENALAPIITWQNEPDRGYSVVTVCTWDRERLFSNITGCLTASGLNILSAEILTRADGIIIDTFWVVDARTGLLVNREERDKFESILSKVLIGTQVDLLAAIAKHKSTVTAYKPVEGDQIDAAVRFDHETSDACTIIDLQTADRVGLLYDVSHAIADLDLDITLAKITTEKGAAIDSFYVTDADAHKITDPERLKTIERKLRHALLHGRKA